MGKFSSRIMAIIFMACWCSMVYTGDRYTEYRGVVTESPDTSWGKVIYFVLYVVLNEVGKYLDRHPMGGYTCPDYCDVDHKKDLTCIIYYPYQSTGYFGEYNELAEVILGYMP